MFRVILSFCHRPVVRGVVGICNGWENPVSRQCSFRNMKIGEGL